MGSAVAGEGDHEDRDYPDPFTRDDEYRRLLAAGFNSLTPENQLGWEFIRPEREVYNLEPADSIMEFARRNRQGAGGTLYCGTDRIQRG